jgi:hypothetical protein
MDDATIRDRIETLVAEEHDLERRGADHEGLTQDEHERLEALGVELDRWWDLLRQREARRSAGLDPDEASIRGADTVEGYEQ